MISCHTDCSRHWQDEVLGLEFGFAATDCKTINATAMVRPMQVSGISACSCVFNLITCVLKWCCRRCVDIVRRDRDTALDNLGENACVDHQPIRINGIITEGFGRRRPGPIRKYLGQVCDTRLNSYLGSPPHLLANFSAPWFPALILAIPWGSSSKKTSCIPLNILHFPLFQAPSIFLTLLHDKPASHG
jgi:hypothetical protein